MSEMILLGVQKLVAQDSLKRDAASPRLRDLVRLHWFRRDGTGATSVTPGALDASGRLGDWPADFGDLRLKLESDYLDAAFASLKHD